jgi:hypothetical protein
MTARGLAGILAAAATLLARAAIAQALELAPPPEGSVPDAGPPGSSLPAETPVMPTPPPETARPTAAPSAPAEQKPQLTWRDIAVVAGPLSEWTPRTSEPMAARWRSNLYGFVELNGMHDSTQSYGPSANNAVLARPGTYAGLHGRTQLTANNSLFGFILQAPTAHGVTAIGHVEVDFFGVQPTDATESTIYTTPSLRMRLFYFRLKQAFAASSLELLVGQYHDLFAWGGAGFYPNSVAFLGIAGEVYHREPQIRLTYSVPLCCVTIDVAAAAVRPVQRDGEVPDLQGGIKISLPRWRGIGAQGFGQPDVQPLAIGVSGVWRRFAVAEFLPVPGEPKIGFGHGLAVNAFVPIIPAHVAPNRLFAPPWNRKNALSLNGEFTVGTGISDLYTGLTGGALFPSLPNPAGLMPAPLYHPNIDPGIVTFDADGNLRSINWRAIVVGFQYYLPVADGRIWVSGNYSRLKSTNIISLTPENSRGGIFYWQQYFDANAYAALTPAVQMGVSYQYTQQYFGDRPFLGTPGGGAHPGSHNHRAEVGFRFFF